MSLKTIKYHIYPKKIHQLIFDTCGKSKIFLWRKWDDTTSKYYKYLIPCTEIFTSAFTPNLKDFRNRLLTRDLHEALAKYVDHSNSECVEDEYKIKFLKGHYDLQTISCLTYLTLNENSKRRATEIFNSMQQIDSKGKSYIAVKPYHPTEVIFLVDGKEINSTTFLVLKIKAFSVPTDNKIRIIPKGKKKRDPSSEGLESVANTQANLSANNIEVVSDEDPTNNSPDTYIKTEVMLIGDKPDISIGTTPISLDNGNIFIAINNSGDVSCINASGGEVYGNAQNSVAQIKNIECSNHVDQQMLLEDVYKALEYLMNKYPRFIEKISFINEVVEEKKDYHLIKYLNLIDKNKRCKWGYGKSFMLIKIYLARPKREIYLMEISRENTSYRGVLFEVANLSQSFLIDLIIQVAKNKGIVKNIMSVNGTYLYNYDHSIGKKSMREKILRELKAYIIGGR